MPIPIYDLSGPPDQLGPQLLANLGNSFTSGFKNTQDIAIKQRQIADADERKRTLAELGNGTDLMTPEGLQRTSAAMLRLGDLGAATQTMQLAANLRAQQREEEGRQQFNNFLTRNAGGGGQQPSTSGGGQSPLLINSESGGKWNAQNNAVGAGGMRGHFGRSQFGLARLNEAKAAGVMPADATPQDFMLSPKMQEAVEEWHWNDIDNKIRQSGFDKLIGQNFAGTPITLQGLRNVAHLGGFGGLTNFIKSGGGYNPADANGTTLRDYLQLGARENPKQFGPSIFSSPQAQESGFAPQQPVQQLPVGQQQGQSARADTSTQQIPPHLYPNISDEAIPALLNMPGISKEAKTWLTEVQKQRAQWKTEMTPDKIAAGKLANEKVSAEIQKLNKELNDNWTIVTDPNERVALGAKPDFTGAVLKNNKGEVKFSESPKPTGPEAIFNEETAKQHAEQFKKVRESAITAPRELETIRTMRTLVNDIRFDSGPLAQTLMRGKQLLEQFGIKDNITSPQEVFVKLSNRMVLDGLGGTLGTGISNTDREFISNTVPNLANTKPGILKLLDLAERQAERKITIAKMAADYASKNRGVVDDGFWTKELPAWAEKNPLVPKEWIAQRNDNSNDKSSSNAQNNYELGKPVQIGGITITRVK